MADNTAFLKPATVPTWSRHWCFLISASQARVSL